MARPVKYSNRIIVRVDDVVHNFIKEYSSTKQLDTSTTIRTLLELGITVALTDLYSEELEDHSTPQVSPPSYPEPKGEV